MKVIHCLHSHSHSDARNVKARISFISVLTFHTSEKKTVVDFNIQQTVFTKLGGPSLFKVDDPVDS